MRPEAQEVSDVEIWSRSPKYLLEHGTKECFEKKT